jgi:CubicO group peptidase (beta-lactamase class C family)
LLSHLVSGTYADEFLPVVEKFEEHLRSSPYGGAALAVYHQGKPVIDVWGGLADASAGREWRENTATVMYSCTKSVSAIVVLRLVEQGLIELDTPVATYWPEFGKHGKDHVSVRDVMAHRAGVPLVDTKLSREQVLAGDRLVAALADQIPLWEPGTAHAYHGLTVGTLLGEIVRRVTGRSLGRCLEEDLAGPLGLDLWIGLPESERHRVAVTLPADPTKVSPELRELMKNLVIEDDRALRALNINDAIPLPLPGLCLENAYNSPDVWAAELPAANGIATARSVAKLHAALIGPVADGGSYGSSSLLSVDTLADAVRPVSQGTPAFGPPSPAYPVWGSGFLLPWKLRPMLGPDGFGHDGAAGGLCFADPAWEVGFTFLPSVMGSVPDLRVNDIVGELGRCLAGLKEAN